jgi:hypothetical protein
MKIKIIPTTWLPNDSGIAVLWCSIKEHDSLLEHFKKELGFEITSEEPNWYNTGMDNIWNKIPSPVQNEK